MKVAIVGSLILTAVIPFWMDKSINYYFEDQSSSRYAWDLYGGPLQVFRYHPAWPEVDVAAEWEIVWLGILCNITFWFVFLMFGQAVLEILKQSLPFPMKLQIGNGQAGYSEPADKQD